MRCEIDILRLELDELRSRLRSDHFRLRLTAAVKLIFEADAGAFLALGTLANIIESLAADLPCEDRATLARYLAGIADGLELQDDVPRQLQ